MNWTYLDAFREYLIRSANQEFQRLEHLLTAMPGCLLRDLVLTAGIATFPVIVVVLSYIVSVGALVHASATLTPKLRLVLHLITDLRIDCQAQKCGGGLAW